MVPKEIFAGQRIVGLVFGIAFVSGMNFYVILPFFPLTYTEVFEPTPYAIGTKSLGAAFGTMLGSVLINALLSIWKDHNRELLLFSCILMSMYFYLLFCREMGWISDTLTRFSRLWGCVVSSKSR